jgi:mono/diheme cytochrome c family protein
VYNAFSLVMPFPSRQVFLAAFAVAMAARGAEPPKAAVIVAERCLKCHNASVRMSGLSLASAADARKGGLHGPAIVPGKPEESLIVRMISAEKPGEKPRMPMQGTPLSEAEVAEIRGWIAQGAVWPEGSPRFHIRTPAGRATPSMPSSRRNWRKRS